MMRQRWLIGAGLLAFLLNAAPFGRADEAASVKVLKEANATIILDDQQPEKPVVGLIMWGTYNASILKEVQQLRSLQKLRIGGPWISDKGLKKLRTIKTLQMLEIGNATVSEDALKELQSAIPKLKIRRASPGETPFAGFAEKK